MTSALARSFAAQISELHEAIRTEWRWPSPDAAFATWLATRVGAPSPAAANRLSHEDQRWDEAPYLATVGYLLAARQVGPANRERWTAGMDKVTQRDPLPADRNSFLFRPIELLGIALGAASADDWPGREWLRDALTRGEHLISTDPWSRAVTAWAARTLNTDLPSLDPPGDDLAVAALAVVEGHQESDAGLFLEAAALSGAVRHDLARAAVLWAALQTTVGAAARAFPASAGPDAVEIVEQLCRRFPAFVTQLGHRHAGRPSLSVDDEYDVQDALHAVLRLHFTDVRDEEWSPSRAATSTRLDLLLKGERIVIETKMMRTSLTQRKLLEEIAIDKEWYRSHPDCGTIIFFVYDPTGRLKNPVALERDASESIGHIQCFVIVSPREHGAEVPS